MNVNKNLHGLFNGVSQQPPTIRLDSQAEIQENAMSSLADGLYKRGHTEHVAKLTSKATKDSFVHPINRDVTERYDMIITGDPDEPIEVFNIVTGAKQTVQYGHLDDDNVFTADDAVKNYLSCSVPKTSFKAVTVADYTIIANNTVSTAMKADTAEPAVYDALIYVRSAIAWQTYSVDIDGHKASVNSGQYGMTTAWIAGGLYASLKKALDPNVYYLERIPSSSCLYVKRLDGKDFTLKATDSWGGMALFGFKGQAQKFEDLPNLAKHGVILKVAGQSTSKYDDYYVKFDSSSDYKTGAWTEWMKPGINNSLDGTTMPHRLVRTGTGVFTFADISWSSRTVGDEVSAPEPSFIGNKINEVFFFKNKFGILSGENVILSKEGDFWNFFVSSIRMNLDDDPIDKAVSTNMVTILYHAIPYNKDLMLFSDMKQFVFRGSGTAPMTPMNSVADPTTSYQTMRTCAPVAAGSNIYFPTPQGQYAGLREYYVQPNVLTDDAADVTSHVPNYVPSDLYRLTTCPNLDILFAAANSEPRSLYIYKYYWRGGEKAQSSWSKWLFSADIIDISVIDNYLMILTSKDGNVCLERINLKRVTTGDLPFRVHLDRQVEVTGSYDAGTNRTTWTLPYYDTDQTFSVIDSVSGAIFSSTTQSSDGGYTTLSVQGNYSSNPVFIGKKYTMRYRLSQWYMKMSGDNRNLANLSGILKMTTMNVGFMNTGYFRVEVTPFRRSTVTHEYTAHVIGVTKIGVPDILTGTKTFPLRCNSVGSTVDLVNDSYLPSIFHTIDLRGFYTSISKAV